MLKYLYGGDNMVNIGVSINDELHKELKMYCVINNKKIKEYLVELIEKDLKQQKENSTASNN
jgi:hypothetical protein